MNNSYFGDKAIDYFEEIIKRLNPSEIFLIRGKKSYELSGASRVISNIVNKTNSKIVEFFDFSENPKIEDLEHGIKILEEHSIDVIVAIGGGSVLDMSKLVRFFTSYQGSPIDGVFVKKKELIPLIALPTTAGTGSETTKFAVLYKDYAKYSVEHEDILPDYSIVYPQLTYSNPKYLTACSGFDALAQAIEAFWNVNATDESDYFAKKAIHLLWKNLPTAVNYPTIEVRGSVAEGAHLAGYAINITKTTAPHAFSYPFTSYYGYPHGHAVALTFPIFFEINCLRLGDLSSKLDNEIYKRKIQFLLKELNIVNIDIKNFFNDYIRTLGLDTTINGINIKSIFDNVNINRLNNNPIIITEKISMQVLNNLLGN